MRDDGFPKIGYLGNSGVLFNGNLRSLGSGCYDAAMLDRCWDSEIPHLMMLSRIKGGVSECHDVAKSARFATLHTCRYAANWAEMSCL